ncbi:MAG TPA: T9SS type A sorting domain-containing protein [Saprospiraceae bacterium]|nr:T9SS type A sorting domain-containing protein [Saprospiraceae bacterium]
MKIRFSYLLFFSLLSLVVLQGNRSGRATVGSEGVTGAPGDASQGGTLKTCAVNGCHTSAAYAPVSISISLLDSAALTPLQKYIPNRNHIVRVKVVPGNGTPVGYGFQMIDLKDAGNAPINGFSDPLGLANNYKLKSLSNGRTYAEHQTMSPTNTFDVVWKAPAAGSGSVSFYAAGNAVNNNFGNSGDTASNTKLQVQEGSSSSVGNAPALQPLALQLSPNPVSRQAQLRWATPQPLTDLQLQVRDVQGRLVWEHSLPASAGEQSFALPAESWLPGLYWVVLQNGTHLGTAKMVKLD